MSDDKIKILFLSANPSDTARIRLDEEIRNIDQALQIAKDRDRFDIEQHWAVRVADLQSLLLRHNPHIVHFSGHGDESRGLILEDNKVRIYEFLLKNVFKNEHHTNPCILFI